MEQIRVQSKSHPLWNQFWDIYINSFPIEEQRTTSHQQDALVAEHYHLICYLNDNELIGFIAYWKFDTYLYIEHFAIAPTQRNGGIGGKILDQFISQTTKKVIIEIEPLDNEMAKRRCGFYSRHGFMPNPYLHPLPKYQPTAHNDMNLLVMSYPEMIEQQCYDQFRSDLDNIVMWRSQQ